MKKIEVLIHTQQWDETRAVLETLNVPATLREVKTFGRTPPRREVYRGSPYVLETATELELSLLVQDAQLETTLAALEPVIGNAEVLITAVEGALRRDNAQPVRPHASPKLSAERQPAAPGFVATATHA